MNVNLNGKSLKISDEALVFIIQFLKHEKLPTEINSIFDDIEAFNDEEINEAIQLMITYLDNKYKKLPLAFQLGIDAILKLILDYMIKKCPPETRGLLRKPRRVEISDHILNLIRPVVSEKIIPDIIEKIDNAEIEVITTEENISGIRIKTKN